MDSDRDIIVLNDRDHALLRPNTYIGSVKIGIHPQWIINEEGSLKLEELSYTEGLLKIIYEIIDNSVDEGIKTDWKFSNKISVDIEKDKIVVEDNGRGLPCSRNSEGKWKPVIAFTQLKAGSNFSDEERSSIGLNGMGSSLTNVFSKYFEVITCDGNNKLKIVCKDNLDSEKHTLLTTSQKTGTKVSFIPDYERFGCSSLQSDIIKMIETRLRFLSLFYPKCSFIFNGEKVNIKVKELSTMLPSPNVVYNTDNVYICIYPSEEPRTLSYVNGIPLPRGGSHVDYILNKVIGDIREKVSKKYKSIKPSDIRNRLGIVVFFKNFTNCAFDSQTKETLTNSQGEVSSYLKSNEVDLDKLTSKILREKVILDNITDLFRLKEELAEKKSLEKLNVKSKKEFESDKYFAPIGKTEKKYLMITEGFSAFSGISPILGRKSIGYYLLRGKIKNCLELSPKKFMENREISELVNILGIDLTDSNTDMNYERVVILTDADNDGTAIAGLILTLFSKIAPRMIEEGRICRLNTPLLIGMKGNKVVEHYFTFPSKSDMKKELKYVYLKGLGSWTKDRFNQVLESVNGFDNLIKPYEKDTTADSSISEWFGSDTEKRKSYLRGKEFHIDKI